jgi:hypothetical protein
VVIVSPVICRALSWVVPVAGITLWPFILLARPPDETTVRHERTHLRQQAELLVIGFYALYIGEWIFHRLKGKNSVDAYMALRFEREAYAYEAETEYLASRPMFAWWKIPLVA